MSVSYRVGDKVRILSRMEPMEKCGVPDKYSDIYDAEFGDVFFDRMFDVCNSVGTIVHVDDISGLLCIEGESWANITFRWMSPNFVQPLSPDTKDLTLNFEDIFR